MEPIITRFSPVGPFGVEPSETTGSDSVRTELTPPGSTAPEKTLSSETADALPDTSRRGAETAMEQAFSANLLKSKLAAMLGDGPASALGQEPGRQVGPVSQPAAGQEAISATMQAGSFDSAISRLEELYRESEGSGMNSIYQTLYEYLQQVDDQKQVDKDQFLHFTSQKFNAALQAVEAKKQEIENNRDDAIGNFIFPASVAFANCAASFTGSAGSEVGPAKVSEAWEAFQNLAGELSRLITNARSTRPSAATRGGRNP